MRIAIKLGALFATIYILIATSAGLYLAYGTSKFFADIKIKNLQGSFISGIKFDKLTYNAKEYDVIVYQADISWNLFAKRYIVNANIKKINYVDAADSSAIFMPRLDFYPLNKLKIVHFNIEQINYYGIDSLYTIHDFIIKNFVSDKEKILLQKVYFRFDNLDFFNPKPIYLNERIGSSNFECFNIVSKNAVKIELNNTLEHLSISLSINNPKDLILDLSFVPAVNVATVTWQNLFFSDIEVPAGKIDITTKDPISVYELISLSPKNLLVSYGSENTSITGNLEFNDKVHGQFKFSNLIRTGDMHFVVDFDEKSVIESFCFKSKEDFLHFNCKSLFFKKGINLQAKIQDLNEYIDYFTGKIDIELHNQKLDTRFKADISELDFLDFVVESLQCDIDITNGKILKADLNSTNLYYQDLYFYKASLSKINDHIARISSVGDYNFELDFAFNKHILNILSFSSGDILIDLKDNEHFAYDTLLNKIDIKLDNEFAKCSFKGEYHSIANFFLNGYVKVDNAKYFLGNSTSLQALSIDGSLDFSVAKGHIKTSTGVLNVSDLKYQDVTLAKKIVANLKHDNLVTWFDLKSDSKLFDLSINLNMHGTEFEYDDFLTNDLHANIEFDAPNLSFLEDLFTQIASPKGNFTAKLDVSGSLVEPKVNGNIALKNVFANLIDYGVDLKNLNLTGECKRNLLDINMIAEYVGKATLTGTVDIFNLDTNLKFIAKSFQFIDNEEANITTDSTLDIFTRDGSLSIIGKIDLHDSSIDLSVANSFHSLTSDVIVDNKSLNIGLLDHPLVFDLIVNVDDLAFKGYDLDTTVDGNMRYINNETVNNSAIGIFDLKGGTIEFFGAALDLYESKVMLNGGPLESAVLDLKAKMQVNTNSFTQANKVPKFVGINALGNALNPNVTFTSDLPLLSKEEILSYLVLSGGFNMGAKKVIEVASQNLNFWSSNKNQAPKAKQEEPKKPKGVKVLFDKVQLVNFKDYENNFDSMATNYNNSNIVTNDYIGVQYRIFKDTIARLMYPTPVFGSPNTNGFLELESMFYSFLNLTDVKFLARMDFKKYALVASFSYTID